MAKEMSRRSFLKKGAAAAIGLAVVPSTVLGKKFGHTAPSDKLNILGVGIGGRGASVLKGLESQNIIGLCDVDWKYAEHVFQRYPAAKRYNDYRRMYDEMLKSADAVMVATADHTHAIIAADAITAGKHVYCEKPLTHTVYESRLLTKLAAKHKVATQMGNQGASAEGVRKVCEWIWNGEIGEVRKVEAPLFKDIFPRFGYWRQLWQYQGILLVLIPVYLILYAKFNLYKPKRFQNRTSEYANLIKANSIGMVFFFIYIIFMKIPHVSRSLQLMFYVLSMLLTIAERAAIRYALERTRRKGFNLKHVVVIGFSAAAEAYIDRIKSNPQWGYTIHGIFDDNLKADFSYRNTFCIGKLKDVEKFLQNTSMDEVAIALSLKEYYKLGDMVAICEKSGVHTKFVPDYYKFISTNPVTEDLNGLPVINIRNVPLTNTVNKCIKRLVDIIGSIVCIILFSPIMAVVAVLVKKSSPGPIIFCQERVGLHNKPFKMYKFRSMGVQSASKEQKAWTVHNDPRVTPVGRIIRKTSLDELPQLFNVLKGDMSLIGPRPERPLFVEKFKEEIPRYMIKHQVRPGMTGWAQVCGFRGDTSIEGRIEHDIFYIENWTLSFDIKILFLTVFKGFVNKNAY